MWRVLEPAEAPVVAADLEEAAAAQVEEVCQV